jgi:uncharacterized protein
VPWSTIVTELLLAWTLGLGVGLSSTFLGLGGGIIIVPLLPLFADMPVRAVIGTSLITVFLVSFQNSLGFQKQLRIDWKVAIWIGSFSSVAAFLAGKLTGVASDLVLHSVFGCVLLILAGLTFMRAGGHPLEVSPDGRPRTTSARTAAGVGFGSGLVSGFTGIGGGVFVVPLLSMLGGIVQKNVVPTSVAAITMTSAAGAMAFLTEGLLSRSSVFQSELRIDLAIALFLGAMVSSRIGMKHQNKLSPRNRDWLIGGLLLALALRTLTVIFLHAG